MSTWRSLPGSALGVMVEIFEHRSPACAFVGHHRWVWRHGTVACSVPRCRATNLQAVLDEFASPAGAEVLARELRRRAS